jgi:Uma2 family endonuclease
MPTVPDTAWVSLAPDWVCEVLSPSTALLDRTKKSDVYRQAGVSWLWFIDPLARTVEVFKLSQEAGGWFLSGTFGGEGAMKIPPFDSVAIDVGALWDAPPPTS